MKTYNYNIKEKQVLVKDNGQALKSPEDILDVSCRCGIECCDGFLKLNAYSSTLGNVGTLYGYILDGEFVFADEATARAAVKVLKALVPPTPTPTATATPTATPTPTSTPTPTPTAT